jgi:hypothetical protein
MQTHFWKMLGIVVVLTASSNALAQGSGQNFSDAVTHSTQGLGQSLVGGAQVSSAIVAVPLKLVGAVGHASDRGGETLMNFAKEDGNQALPVADETITVGPAPSQALQRQQSRE